MIAGQRERKQNAIGIGVTRKRCASIVIDPPQITTRMGCAVNFLGSTQIAAAALPAVDIKVVEPVA